MGKGRDYQLRFEIGYTSAPLSKKLSNGYTHKWNVYVKGIDNAKIENCIQRVVFTLHESFPDHIREVTSPPYQVKETGYAGFVIPVEIYFKTRDKPNHFKYDLDLCLLNDKPNSNMCVQRLVFKRPNKDFEKCLIKSGAQLIPEKPKRDRSSSPPIKKQKFSSLIPSKDMKQTPTQSSRPQPASQPPAASQPQSNHHSSSQKPKQSSREFMDLFGAPLVYNKHKHFIKKEPSSSPTPPAQHRSSSSSDHRKAHISTAPTTNSSSSTTIKHSSSSGSLSKTSPPFVSSVSANSHASRAAHSHALPPSSTNSAPNSSTNGTSVPTSGASNGIGSSYSSSSSSSSSSSNSHILSETPNGDQYLSDLQLIQTKISCLSDCDRLQKIVDIIQEAGEWFNLTSKKFEFDLKRLGKKTLNEIEKCLQI